MNGGAVFKHNKPVGKSTLPISSPNGGIKISETVEFTILVNAPPIMIPTAISITLPRITKVLNSLITFFIMVFS